MEQQQHNTEFEEKVLTGLTSLNTKMNLMISDDGEKGFVPSLQKRVTSLEKKSWIFIGSATGIGGVIHWAIDFFRLYKGH